MYGLMLPTPESAYRVYESLVRSAPDYRIAAYAVSLFESIDAALTDNVPEDYLQSLLALVDGWNDMCLILDVAATAYSRGMDPTYVQAVYLLDFAYDSATLDERLTRLHVAGVPAEYAVSTASGHLCCADIVAAWEAGLAPEYAKQLFS